MHAAQIDSNAGAVGRVGYGIAATAAVENIVEDVTFKDIIGAAANHCLEVAQGHRQVADRVDRPTGCRREIDRQGM